MITAIIAGLVAAILVAVVLVVLYYIIARNKTPQAGSGKKVQQVNTYGVGSSPLERYSVGVGTKSGDVHVSSSESGSSKKPADALTSRFTAVSVLALAIFGSLTAKLWDLQVLSSSEYSTDAEQNRYTTVSTPAPRGYICDVNGTPMVKNRSSQTVLADPDVAEDRDIVRRLSAVLGVPANIVKTRINDSRSGAQSQRVVVSDARLRDVAFIAEHADAFPGVTVESRSVRDYPYGALAAHILGYTGAPSEEQLNAQAEGRDIKATDMVGKSGLEYTYDHLLAGDHGQRRVIVDVKGNVIEVVSETQPRKGSDLYLTIDSRVQYVADSTLAELIAPEGLIGEGTGVAGAIVVMDVRDGGIVALASYPTYDPDNFTGGIPQDIWDLYNTEESYAPLNNRVSGGLYAAASTYKPFTSIASLTNGLADYEMEWNCKGYWDGFKTGSVQRCWEDAGHGKLDLRGGIVHSCDVVFYELGKGYYDNGPYGTGQLTETALQDELSKYHFEEKTGIDLPSESVGRIPTPEWKAEHWKNVPAEAVWRGGDYTNMIIGQGDVLVTPLRMAVAYGSLATGITMKPHLLKEIRNENGDIVVSYEPEVIDQPDVSLEYLDFVREAMRGVVTENSSTAKVFESYGLEAAGKSGTAEHLDRGDDAWFVAYAPYDDPKYVVSVVIEQGGGGSATAAPIAAKVLSAAMQAAEGTLEARTGRVAGSTGKSVEYEYSSEGRTD